MNFLAKRRHDTVIQNYANSLAFVLSYNSVTIRKLSHKVFSEISSWVLHFKFAEGWRSEFPSVPKSQPWNYIEHKSVQNGRTAQSQNVQILYKSLYIYHNTRRGKRMQLLLISAPLVVQFMILPHTHTHTHTHIHTYIHTHTEQMFSSRNKFS
jgi:hypothetical protein